MGNLKSYSEINNSKGQKIIFMILFAVVAMSVAVIFRYYIWPLFFAVISYIVLKPVRNSLAVKLKSKRIATYIVVAGFLFLIILPAILLLLLLANQSLEVYHYVSDNIRPENIKIYIYKNAQIKKMLAYFNIREKVMYGEVVKFVSKYSMDVFDSIMKAVGFSASFLINILFTVIILVFLFGEAHKVSAIVYKLLPFPDDVESDIFNRIKTVIKVLVFGNLMIMTLQGVMVGFGFLVFGVKVWMVGAAASAVFSLIPGVGTSIVWVPAVGYLLYLNKPKEAFLLGLWCLVSYLVLENIVKPKVFGKKLNFHPILLFFLLIGSVMTFNLPGIIIGPLLMTVLFSLWEIYRYLDLYGQDSKKMKKTR